jgi:dihydrofolate synthase / folylpolyglutamate synthase
MPVIKNLAAAHDMLRQLYGRYKTGVASDFYTLDRMRGLMEYLGNPQDSFKVVHVAGTSGKTSTAYYAAALLGASGAKVGLNVSPHLIEVNERVQIDLVPLPEDTFCAELGTFMDIVAASAMQPTYFEVLVAFAFWEFARQGVEYAVVEVGLGGLLDGTNVITRTDKVCIITDIGLDHVHVLGDTISKIAAQKAGIIQPGNHVFMYIQSRDVMEVTRATCDRQHAVLHEIPSDSSAVAFALPRFQQRNFFLAKQAITYVLHRYGAPALTAPAIRTAADTPIPGRMEIFHDRGKIVVIDGAHNEQKMTALMQSMQAAFPGKAVAALVAAVHGPDARWQQTLDVLLPMVSSLVVTSFYQEEKDRIKTSVDAQAMGEYVRLHSKVPLTVEADPAIAYRALHMRPEPVLLVTGSLYFLQEVRSLMPAIKHPAADAHL